jgi:P27 family predicted phage terminase small subunit
MWDDLAPKLARSGVLTEVDTYALAALCQSWSTYEQATATVAREGQTIEGYRGSTVRHPAAIVAKQALAEFLRLATEFGLTPASRARISVPGSGDVDPLEDLLR